MANSKVNISVGGPSTKTIELDCDPFSPRPDTFIREVIKGTGLEQRETVNRFFGNWTWDYNDVDDEVWAKIRPILQRRIRKLFKEGFIRYGSW